ncbi:Zn-ribbon domain-containing OB-fold protein [Mesorhizobium sp. A556]
MVSLNLQNADGKEYWEGAANGKLRFQKCRQCEAIQFPPRHHCATCWEAELEWIDCRGEGTVESFTVVRRAPISSFRDKVPYVAAAIRTREGPRMITNLMGEDALDVNIGDPVKVEFVANEAGDVLPQFRRVRAR